MAEVDDVLENLRWRTTTIAKLRADLAEEVQARDVDLQRARDLRASWEQMQEATHIAPNTLAKALRREHKRLARLGLAGDCDCRYCA